jgi:hypothetical protein
MLWIIIKGEKSKQEETIYKKNSKKLIKYHNHYNLMINFDGEGIL